jgi:1,4-alpha-glucan branching enzyme
MPSSKTPKKRANFQFVAPGARQVCIAGTFNDWDPVARPLRRGKDDVFRTWMNLPTGTYEYRFVVDNEWHEDPAADAHKPTPYGGHNSVLVV